MVFRIEATDVSVGETVERSLLAGKVIYKHSMSSSNSSRFRIRSQSGSFESFTKAR
jgi:hypothetical protein